VLQAEFAAKQKREWCDQLKHNDNDIKKADLECTRIINTTKAMAMEHVNDLKKTLQTSQDDRVRWQLEVYDHIRRIRNRTTKISHEASKRVGDPNALLGQKNAKKDKPVDKKLNEMKKTVGQIEHDLSVFKEKQRQDYDELTLLEGTLMTTLKTMEDRFTAWTDPAKANAEPILIPRPRTANAAARDGGSGSASSNQRPQTAGSKRLDNLTTANQDPQVAKIRETLDALQAEIDHDGGLTGGWIKDDHDSFLRVYQKHKNFESSIFIETCSQLINRTHEDIVDHVNWYTEYLKRTELKKNLLAQWKTRRQQVLREAHEAESAKPKADKLTAEAIEEERERRKRLREDKKMHDEHTRERITAWKERRAEEIAAKRRAEEDKIEEAKQKEIARMAEHKRTRAAIVQYADEKKEQKQREKELKAMKERIVIPRATREQIHERNMDLTRFFYNRTQNDKKIQKNP